MFQWGNCYKTANVLDEKLNKISTVDIYNRRKVTETLSELSREIEALLGNKNFTFYLRLNTNKTIKKKKKNENIKRDGDICEIDLKYFTSNDLYESVNSEKSYFYVKINTKIEITGNKDTDCYIFNFLNNRDIVTMSKINSYFNSICRNFIRNKVHIKCNPEDLSYLFFNYDREFLQYLSKCCISFKDDYGRGEDRKIWIKYAGSKETWNFGKNVEITFPDGVKRILGNRSEYSCKKFVKTKTIFDTIFKMANEKYNKKYELLGFSE